ncbi:MAG: glutathione S-transferase N-terminal domain-containing protein [Pseudolabrys sp.]
MDTPLLWHIPLSHYSEKVRWALDFKGITHRRRVLGPDYLIRVWRATGQGKLPVMWLDDQAVADSTRIIAPLEEHYPEPPLYPRDAAMRQRALALEDDLDETLGPALRAAIVTPLFQHDPDIALRVLTTGMGGKAYRTLRPLLRIFPTFYRFRHRIRESNLERDRAIVAVALDRARAARPRVSRRRDFHRRRPHGCRAARGAPAASRDSVPTSGGVTVVSAGVPRNAAAASSRAMGRRHLPPASRTLAAIAKRRGAP